MVSPPFKYSFQSFFTLFLPSLLLPFLPSFLFCYASHTHPLFFPSSGGDVLLSLSPDIAAMSLSLTEVEPFVGTRRGAAFRSPLAKQCDTTVPLSERSGLAFDTKYSISTLRS